jgi:hypothetical protein
MGSPEATVDGRRTAGDVVVRYGSPDGLDPARTVWIHQGTPLVPDEVEARDRFGAVLAAGDLDGDGYDELVVGSPDEGAGALPGVGQAVVVPGGPGGLRPRAAFEILPGLPTIGVPATNRQAFGRSLAIADLNGDGSADLAIGATGQAFDGVGPVTATPTASATVTARPTVTPTGPTPTDRPPPTPTLSPTPRPPSTIYLPYGARVWSLGRFATPLPLPEG